MEDLESGEKLSNRQFGFRKGKSTIHAEKWIHEAKKSSRSRWKILVALDFKNAFNSAS